MTLEKCIKRKNNGKCDKPNVIKKCKKTCELCGKYFDKETILSALQAFYQSRLHANFMMHLISMKTEQEEDNDSNDDENDGDDTSDGDNEEEGIEEEEENDDDDDDDEEEEEDENTDDNNGESDDWCNEEKYGTGHTMCIYEAEAQPSCGNVTVSGITDQVRCHRYL